MSMDRRTAIRKGIGGGMIIGGKALFETGFKSAFHPSEKLKAASQQEKSDNAVGSGAAMAAGAMISVAGFDLLVRRRIRR